MAFVALSPIRNAHWVISGEMPILANTGTKMKDIKAHLAVADTIKRLTSAVKRMKRINIHKLLKEAEDSRLAPKWQCTCPSGNIQNKQTSVRQRKLSQNKRPAVSSAA